VNAAGAVAKLKVLIPRLQNTSAEPGEVPNAKYKEEGTIV
jgi:hypothetical protein